MTELPLVLADFEARARELLAPGPLSYYTSGAGAQITLRENVEAWERVRLAPRMLVGVVERDLSTTLLGRSLPHPLITAPMAYMRLAHDDGEIGVARAAAATRTSSTLATLATTSQADLVAGAGDAPRWFQLYVFRDRGITRALVEGAVEHGFEALVVTVDLPVIGLREADVALGETLPPDLAIPAVDAAGRSARTIAETTALVDPGLTWSASRSWPTARSR